MRVWGLGFWVLGLGARGWMLKETWRVSWFNTFKGLVAEGSSHFPVCVAKSIPTKRS